VNTGTTRIVIVAALVVAGVVVLLNGFPSAGSPAASGGTSNPSPSTSPSGSPSTSPSQPPAVHHQKPKDVTFVVLNGTTSVGLAAQWDTKLTTAGFTQATAPGNAPTTGVQATVLYYRPGAAGAQNKADAAFVGSRFFPDAKVKTLRQDIPASLIGDANVVVIVGADVEQPAA